MATLTPVTSDPVAIGTSATTIYTVDSTNANTKLINAQIRLTNIAAGPITVTVYAVPSGGTAGDTNAMVKDYSVAAADYLDLYVGNLEAGAIIQALASAATSITAHFLSGTLRQ